MKLTESLKTWLRDNAKVSDNATDDVYRAAAASALKDGTLDARDLATLTGEPNARSVFGGNDPHIRVRKPSEQYSTVKTVAKHAKYGTPVNGVDGRPVETSSQMELAKIGAFVKHLASRSGVSNVTLTEHESEILRESAETDPWSGDINDKWFQGTGVKALLDNVLSGGINITPEHFDEAIVNFPLLHSEIAPALDWHDVARGRLVESASVGTPTMAWGTTEPAPIDLFDTADLVKPLDTSIYPVVTALELGLDFLSDSIVDIGRIVTGLIGERLAAELDHVAVLGDGLTQPGGIFQANGTVAVPSENGTGGPITLADLEALIFAVGKQYRNAAMRPALVMNDRSYSRIRGIAVSESDQRRIFGLDHQSYRILEYPVRIQNDIPNTHIAFACLSRYRMYRRLGQSVKFETGGKDLTLRNMALLTVRGRYGGRVVDPAAFSVMSDAQA
jgi:HK97 family phage major capsid protein